MGQSLDQLGHTLSWWDLKCILRWLPHNSALSRLKNPETWWRTIEVELAGKQLDALHGANWQRGGGGGQRPESVLGPWPEPDRVETPKKPRMTATQIRDELARRRAQRASQAS